MLEDVCESQIADAMLEESSSDETVAFGPGASRSSGVSPPFVSTERYNVYVLCAYCLNTCRCLLKLAAAARCGRASA